MYFGRLPSFCREFEELAIQNQVNLVHSGDLESLPKDQEIDINWNQILFNSSQSTIQWMPLPQNIHTK